MAALERLLGSSPRVKVAGALLRLGDLTVSRAEIAREAHLFRTSTNRVLEEFEVEGIILRVTNDKRPLFKANLGSPYLQLLSRFSSALELIDLTSSPGRLPTAAGQAASAEFYRAVRRITGTAVSGAGSGLASLGSTTITLPAISDNAIHQVITA